MVHAQDYTELSKTSFIFSFCLVTSLFFLWGLSYGLLDVLNQHFLTIFGITKTQSTLLQFAYFFAYFAIAPFMGALMTRIGYKRGIHLGLAIFSIGAIVFWPAAKFRLYGMFVAFTFVAGSGLATLEVAANTYMVVLGSPKYAAFRITFAQGFNGIATVIGPQIASHTFFHGDNEGSLDTVQYVYLAMSMFAVLLNIGLAFCKLPEVRQATTAEQDAVLKEHGWKGVFKKHHTIFGALAEFCYVGAQVAVASNTMFYLVEQGYTEQMSSNLFSACQAVFTVGRFIGVAYLRFVDPSFALFVHGIGLVLFSILTSTIQGKGGVACLFMVFFFESVCYPVIYSIATKDLGAYAKIGGSLVVMGVSGGACWPSAQAALGDAHTSHISFLVPMVGFIPLMVYGAVMWATSCKRHDTKSILSKYHEGVDTQIIERRLSTVSSRGQSIVDPKAIEAAKAQEAHIEHPVREVDKYRTGGKLSPVSA